VSEPISLVPASTLGSLYSENSYDNQRINKLTSLYDYSNRFRQSYVWRWRRNRELYFNIDRQLLARPEKASKIFVPRPYLVVQTKVPKIVNAILSKTPLFTVLPTSDDDLIRARIAQELISKQWSQQPNATQDMVNMFTDTFIYGLGIGKAGWEFKQEIMPSRNYQRSFFDPVTSQVMLQEFVTQEMVTTVDRPFFKNIDLEGFYWDPTASTLEECKFIIQKYRVPRFELEIMERMGVYKNVSKIPKGTSKMMENPEFGGRSLIINPVSSQLNGYTQSADQYGSGDPVYQMVEIMECWWIDGHQKVKTVISDKQCIIQDIAMPYWHQRWPFYQFKNTPITGEFVGLSEIDPIAELCLELNDIRSLERDNRIQFTKAFWIVNRAAHISMDDLENMPPGGILEVTGAPREALDIQRPPQLDGSTIMAKQGIDTDIQMTSGANDIAIGMSTKSQVRTATTGSLMQQSTDMRFNLTALLYLEQLRKVGKDFLSLNQQFMTEPLAVKILGPQGSNLTEIKATPYDIPQDYDLYVTLGAELQGDKDIIRQQTMQLFQIMSQLPGYDLYEGALDVYREFGVKNPERFFPQGSQVVPSWAILDQKGVKDSSVRSGYLEQMGGMMGGGTQQVPQAASQADVLQFSKGLSNESMVM